VIEAPEKAGLEILTNWQLIAILAIFISVIFVAMAYAIGIGFEMPQMEAWARSELTQVFANVVIVISLIAVVGLIDIAIMGIANSSGIPDLYCYPGENCLNRTANAYFEDYITTAAQGAKAVLEDNLVKSGWSNRRVGAYCTVFIPCVQASISNGLVPHFLLDVDRNTIIFEYYQNLLGSMHAQKFFVNEICFKMGPLVLALGLVCRAFFFTRKLGGLLIAIAAGVMFFFPTMYIVDWMTLDMAVTGDGTFGEQDSACPAECGYSPPLAYYFNTTQNKYVGLTMTKDVYQFLGKSKRDDAKKVIYGDVESATSEGGVTVKTCAINSSKSIFSTYKITGAQEICDRSCRELPYPHTSSKCANYSMQLACTKLPEPCKVKKRVVEMDEAEYSKCPSECRIIPPMRNNCYAKNVSGTIKEDEGRCLESRFDCRFTKRSDLSWRPSIDKGVKGAAKCNTYTKECIANMIANESCVYVLPEFGPCEELCAGCPEECRFVNESDVSGTDKVASCFDNGNLFSECKSCPSTCKINMSHVEAVEPPAGNNNCSNCPLNHRLLPGTEGLPNNYTTDTSTLKCGLNSCSPKYRVQVPMSACDSCMFVEEAYTYDPPINYDCSDLCKPPDNAPAKEAGDYTKIGEDGLVGREEIKAVSKLMIPAYVLPLFNIAATIIVIRSLSGMLGGDIEIPGLAKIF
jgi:hypothetical protein